MRKRLRIGLALLVTAVVVGIVWLVLRTPAEPVYQGKRLRAWLQGYSGTNLERHETDAAVRQMGTNSIPTHLKMLRAYDSPLKTKLLVWASQRRYLRIHYTNPSVLHHRAFMGLQALGPEAAPAVPKLVEILEQNLSESSDNYAARTLAVIGPEARPAVPLLLRAATNANVSEHWCAIWALGEIHADPDLVVPVLIKALGNPSGQDQLFAVIALGRFKGDAKSAVPALLKVLESLNPTPGSAVGFQTYTSQLEIRSQLKKTLQQIDPESYTPSVTSAGQAQSNRLDFLAAPKDPFWQPQ